MSNPMEKIHALRKRIESEVGDIGVELMHMNVIPRSNGPDQIVCSFNITGDAVKSSEEKAAEALEDDFFSVLGDMSVETDDDGNVTLEGGGEAADEESAEERKAREDLRDERIRRMLGSLKDEDE